MKNSFSYISKIKTTNSYKFSQKYYMIKLFRSKDFEYQLSKLDNY